MVAALTMPTLIANHQKKVVETKVKKFYSVINNALQRSIAEYGDIEDWIPERKYYTYDENLAFIKKYFLPYIQYTKYENCSAGDGRAICVYMIDGGMFYFAYDSAGGDFIYFLNGKLESNYKNRFAFQFNKINGNDTEDNPIIRENHSNKIIEPYTYQWDGNYESLINHPKRGCTKDNDNVTNNFCAKLLQINGWEITKDYPW